MLSLVHVCCNDELTCKPSRGQALSPVPCRPFMPSGIAHHRSLLCFTALMWTSNSYPSSHTKSEGVPAPRDRPVCPIVPLRTGSPGHLPRQHHSHRELRPEDTQVSGLGATYTYMYMSGIASNPGSHSDFRRLQYEKCKR